MPSTLYDDNDNAFDDDAFDAKNTELNYSNNSLNNADYTSDIKDGEVDVGALVPVPPDGGYGWIIVVAAFFCNFIVDGICNSFSPFINSYVEVFQSNVSTVGFIVSCEIGAYLLVGPIVSGLTNKYGARIVVVAGSIISGLAILASMLATNVYVMIILYGIIGGAGFGLIYLPAICVVCYYFEKKRSLATGLAVAGSGAGTIVLPKMCMSIIQAFGYKAALAALAALTFSGIGWGILYRPLTAPVDSEDEETGEREMQLMDGKGKKPLDTSSDRAAFANENNGSAPANREIFKRMRSAVSESDDPSLRPLIDGGKGGTGLYPKVGDQNVRPRKRTINSESGEGGVEHKQSKVSVREYAQSLTRLNQGNPIKGAESLASVASNVDPKEFAKPMSRNDIFYHGSIQNLPEFKKEGRDYRKYRESIVSIPAEVAAQGLRQAEGDNTEDDLVEKTKCSCLPPAVRSTFSQMLDFELLKEPAMILLSFSNLFAMLGFYVPIVFILAMASEKGVDAGSASWLLPVFGIFNTVGRVIFGWLADRKWLSALALNNISLIVCGVLSLICPYFSSFALLMTYSILFGFFISGFICLTSIVLADLLGLDKLTNAFGILIVSRSIACFVGTPLAGFVFEKTGSYDASFVFAGFLLILGGLSTIIISIMDYLRGRKAKKALLLEETKNIDDSALGASAEKNGAITKN